MMDRAWARTLMVVLLLAGLLVAALPDLGQAQEKTSGEAAPMAQPGQTTTLLGPFTLQAGYKVWYAQWQSRSILTSQVGANQQTSSFGVMNGPQITLGYSRPSAVDWFKGLFVSYQYLNGGFGFHSYTNAGITNPIDSALRTDTTLSVSLPVYKGYGAFFAYYHSLQRFQFGLGSTSSNATLRFKGPVLGLFGSQPIPDTQATLYGNVGVGWLTLHPGEGPKQNTNTQFKTESIMAYSIETGVNYGLPQIWKIRPTAQIGFRAQILQQTFPKSFPASTEGNAATDLGANTRANDILWGPTFMLATQF